MSEVYEYRLAKRRNAIWLASIVIAFLIGFAIANTAPQIMIGLWAVTGAAVAWSLISNPLCGIRVDDDHLVLNAWRKPRAIPLADIDYLRTSHSCDDCNVTIVYKDGREEGTVSAHMPPPATLACVMAERGIAVLDRAFTP